MNEGKFNNSNKKINFNKIDKKEFSQKINTKIANLNKKNLKNNNQIKGLKVNGLSKTSENQLEKFNIKLNKNENKLEKAQKKIKKEFNILNKTKRGVSKQVISVGQYIENTADNDDLGSQALGSTISKTGESYLKLKNTKTNYLTSKEKRKSKQHIKLEQKLSFNRKLNEKANINNKEYKKFFIKNAISKESQSSFKDTKKIEKSYYKIFKNKWKKDNKLTAIEKFKYKFIPSKIKIKNFFANIFKSFFNVIGKTALRFIFIGIGVVILINVSTGLMMTDAKQSDDIMIQAMENQYLGDSTLPEITSIEQFLNVYGRSFRRIADEYNVYASVMMAQAILESNGARALAGTKTNIYGIKCYNESYGCGIDVSTNEELSNGNIITIKSRFQEAQYGGIDNAILLVLDFLENGSAFRQSAIQLTKTYHKDYKSATLSLYKDIKYATDSSYTNKLNEIIEKYNLTIYDTAENPDKPVIKNVKFKKVLGNTLANISSIPVNVSVEEIDKYITSHFGYRIDPVTGESGDFHRGIDIAMPLNTEIYSTMSGEVIYAEYNFNGYGNVVFVKNGNLETRYAHLNGFAVKVGDIVNKGTLLGYMGTTGYSSGVHLHYEILIDGTKVNPYPYMKQTN